MFTVSLGDHTLIQRACEDTVPPTMGRSNFWHEPGEEFTVSIEAQTGQEWAVMITQRAKP